MSNLVPTKMPETGQESTQVLAGQSKPADLSSFDTASAASTGVTSMPTLEPPVAVKGEQAITVWLSDKRINATFCIFENRNAWAAVAGVGWKKLANNSDSAIVALNMLATHARQMNSPVNYREEADGMIHEMYVW